MCVCVLVTEGIKIQMHLHLILSKLSLPIIKEGVNKNFSIYKIFFTVLRKIINILSTKNILSESGNANRGRGSVQLTSSLR